MKKILAILLSVLMLTSTGVIGVIFASADGARAVEQSQSTVSSMNLPGLLTDGLM
jgi:hypothetical protein